MAKPTLGESNHDAIRTPYININALFQYQGDNNQSMFKFPDHLLA